MKYPDKKSTRPIELEHLWTWRDARWNFNKFICDPAYLYGTRREDGFYNKEKKRKDVCKSLAIP